MSLFLTEASTTLLTREERRRLRAEFSSMSMEGLVVHLRGSGCWVYDGDASDAVHERLMGVHGMSGYGLTVSPTRPADNSLRQ